MTSHRTDRRRFLKTTAGAIAAATAAPGMGIGRSARAESPHERLNVAAIGVGPRGAAVSRQAGSLGNMVAVCDVDRRAAERFAQVYDGKPDTYADYREVLQRSDVDVVIIGTPDHWHTKLCIDAMKAGKDVYCEKPLTVTIAEGKQIEEVVRETDAVLQVGTQQRSEYMYTVFMRFDCTLRFANGNSINLVSRGNEIIIEGDEGRIRVNRGGLTGRPVEEINASPADRQWLNEEVTRLYRGMRLTSHMGNFFDCVKSRKLPISDVFTHNRAMELSHTANIAMLLKRKLRWDAQRREFKDDAQANAHAIVSRSQREPWSL